MSDNEKLQKPTLSSEEDLRNWQLQDEKLEKPELTQDEKLEKPALAPDEKLTKPELTPEEDLRNWSLDGEDGEEAAQFGQSSEQSDTFQSANPAAILGGPGNMLPKEMNAEYFERLNSMDSKQQVQFVQDTMMQMQNGGKIDKGLQMAVMMDKAGLDLSQRTNSGTYEVPLQGVMYAEASSLSLIQNGQLSEERIQSLAGKPIEDWYPDDREALENATQMNQMMTKFCFDEDGKQIQESSAKGKELKTIFKAIDETSDVEWMADAQGELLKGNPDAMNAAKAAKYALNPQGALQNSTVQLDKESLANFDKYQEMLDAAKQGKLTPDMMMEGFGSVTKQESEKESGFGEFFDGLKVGKDHEPLVEKDGNGMIFNIPNGFDVHVGKTTENQKSGRFLDIIDENLGKSVLREGKSLKDVLSSGVMAKNLEKGHGAGKEINVDKEIKDFENTKKAVEERHKTWSGIVSPENQFHQEIQDAWDKLSPIAQSEYQRREAEKAAKMEKEMPGKQLNQPVVRTTPYPNSSYAATAKRLQFKDTKSLSTGVSTAKPGERGMQATSEFGSILEKQEQQGLMKQMGE